MTDLQSVEGIPISDPNDQNNRSVATDAKQDAGADKVNSEFPKESKCEIDDVSTKGECNDDSIRTSCQKEWVTMKSKGTHLECSFYKYWVCLTCANMRAADMQIIALPDSFWAWLNYKHVASELLSKHNCNNQVISCLKKFEQNLERKLENKIEAALQNLPHVLTNSLDIVHDKLPWYRSCSQNQWQKV